MPFTGSGGVGTPTTAGARPGLIVTATDSTWRAVDTDAFSITVT